MMSKFTNHRLHIELKQIQRNKSPLFDVHLVDDDITKWHAILHSNSEHFFLGGIDAKIHIDLDFSVRYPKIGPRIRLLHGRLPHPNIALTGMLCMDVLDTYSVSGTPYAGWSPAYSMEVLLIQIHAILFDNSYMYCTNKISIEDAKELLLTYDCDICSELDFSKLSNDTLLKEDNNGKDEGNYNLMRLPVVTRIKCFDEEKEVAQKVLGIQRNDNPANDEKLKENCSGNTHNDSSGKFQVVSSRKKKNKQQRRCIPRHSKLSQANFLRVKAGHYLDATESQSTEQRENIFFLLDESSADESGEDEDECSAYTDPWTKLSENEFMSIMMYSHPAACLRIACTSKTGNILVKYGTMWRQYLKRHLNLSSIAPSNVTDWKRCYALCIDNTLENLKCFYTKQSWYEDKNVLGWGLQYTVNPRTSEVDYISSEMDVLSYTAYKRSGVRKSMWNESFQLFLPIYISRSHFKRALKIYKRTFVQLNVGIEYGNCSCCDRSSFYCLNKLSFTSGSNRNKDIPSSSLMENDVRSNESNWRSNNNRPKPPCIGKISRCTTLQRGSVFHQNMILTTIPKIMNTFVVQIARCAKKASKLVNGYTSVFRIFVAFIEEYPGLKTAAKMHLQRFIDDPEARTKKNYKSLGELWPLIAVCPNVDLVAFNRAYFSESFTRSVLWVFREAPEMSSKSVDEIDQNIVLSTFFQGRSTSNKLHMVNLVLVTSICRPNLVNINIDLADLISNYDWLCCNVPKKTLSVIMKQLAKCNSITKKKKSWLKYLRFVGIDNIYDENTCNKYVHTLIKKAVKDSMQKGYHTVDTDFRKIHKNGTSRILHEGESCGIDEHSRIDIYNSWRYSGDFNGIYLDASMLFFNFDSNLEAVLDYSNTEAFYSAAKHSGDIMHLPENKGTHKITLHLNRMPEHIHAMYLVASVWATATMKDIKHPSVKCVQNPNTSNSSRGHHPRFSRSGKSHKEERASNSLPVELCRFELDTECDMNKDVKNVIMCKIYRKYRDGGWIFKAIGAKGMEGNACNYDPIVRIVSATLKDGAFQ